MNAPDEQGPTTSLGYQLKHAALRWQRVLTDALRPLELTPTQFAVLGGLYWLTRVGPLPSQAQLAHQASLDPVMTSKIVRSLTGAGLVVRHRDPTDSRAFHLALTAEGRARAEAAVEVVITTEREFFTGLGLDLEDLARTLEAISGLSSTRPAHVTSASRADR